jgi:hypothetical protein
MEYDTAVKTDVVAPFNRVSIESQSVSKGLALVVIGLASAQKCEANILRGLRSI